MDEILSEFLTETSEHLEGVETQLVQFERDPTDASLVAGIFRLVHTIKGTSSFLGLSRLQRVAHSAENLIGALRDGAPPTAKKVSLILSAIDRIKEIVGKIEILGQEPDGDDDQLIMALEAHVSEDGVEAEPVVEKQPAKTARKRTRKAKPVEKVQPEQVSEIDDSDGDGEDDDDKVADAGLPASAADTSNADGSQKGKAKQPSKQNNETIRVAVDTIERIMQLVSELVLNRNQLLELTRNRENDSVKAPLQRLSALTTDLQDAVMRARMQPVGRLFANLPRLMRELSADLNKKIDLITEGADTELDRQLIEVLRDPLTHIIRNCADHGLETPQDRIAAGKPEYGEIRVTASHEAGQITIDITDDGRGLNLDKIRQKALSSGMATEDSLAQMSTEELCRFIFAPGFSTAAKVTSVSGRGVGMDVVRSNIESIGGSVTLSTVPGQGSRFSLKIPLTLAIAPALIVQVGEQRFALPQHAVVEAVGLGGDSRHVLEKVQDALVLKLRNEVIPVLDLSVVLGLQERQLTDAEEDRLVVILRVGEESFGVRVDAVLDVQEIVVKPLNGSLAHLKIFTGQTILGDGSVVLILDPAGIGTKLGIEKSGEQKRDAAKEILSGYDRTRLVLFRAGEGLPKVLPISLLSRIEMVDADRIERSDGRYLMLHQGKLMPLLPTSPMQAIEGQPHPVLVITASNHTIGLIVDEIIDIIEEKLQIQLPSSAEDIVGSAEINGNPVELIDVTYYLQMAYSSLQMEDAKTVLLADQDIFFRDTLKPVLVGAGYNVVTAGSAAEIMELFEQRSQFDAILIDAEMRRENGANMCQHIRDQLVNDDLPMVRLYDMLAHAVLNIPIEHRMTMNVSKLDRQTLLNTISSLMIAQEQIAGELAA